LSPTNLRGSHHYAGRLFRQLALGISYTWSRAIDNFSDFGLFAQNPFDLASG
jgi:hypothetical protein